MSCPRYDWHIHTTYLKCANETMTVPAILKKCEDYGVTALGLTDHVHVPEDVARHRAIAADLRASEPKMDVFFGVEANFMSCDGPFPLDESVKAELGFQFVIGGIHDLYLQGEYNLARIVDVQHRHHIRTCEDPLIDVLVHPYWFNPYKFKERGWPLVQTMKMVPESYTRELGYVARETGTAIEVNADACLVNDHHGPVYAREYVDYLSILNEEGVTFSVGSDAHDIEQLQEIRVAWDVMTQLEVPDERIYKPSCEPFVKGR